MIKKISIGDLLIENKKSGQQIFWEVIEFDVRPNMKVIMRYGNDIKLISTKTLFNSKVWEQNDVSKRK